MSDGKIRLGDLSPDLAPEIAAVLFATEWDESIKFFKAAAIDAGLGVTEFEGWLDEQKELLGRYIELTPDMTTEETLPLVGIRDMMVLASLARYVYEKARSN